MAEMDDVVIVNGRRYVPESTYKMTAGAERIAFERARQMLMEDWTPEHDDEHVNGELANAAVCYAASWLLNPVTDGLDFAAYPPADWPWHPDWWKPSRNPIRNLEKAGALIAAEIDRLLRKRLTDMDKRLDDMGVQ